MHVIKNSFFLFHYFDIALNSEIFQYLYEIFLSPWTMKQGWSLVQDYKYLLILLVW